MSHAIIIGVQCHYCSKFKPFMDIIQMSGGAKICLDCEQRHIEALEAIGTGNFMGHCSECNRPWEELKSIDGKMAVHYENGKYKAMCLDCDRAYVPKRRDLYGDTEFGHSIGLK